MRKSMLTLALFAAMPFAAQAEVYCVGTAAQLAAAFSDARTSPAASEIRVRAGVYDLPDTGGSIALQYVAASSLTMSGGWTGANGSCTGQGSDPEQTILRPNFEGSLLRFFLLAEQGTEIELTNFSFRQASGTAASCIQVESDAGSNGVVRIDRNAFRLCNRSQSSGSAIRATARSADIYIRNNVFADNASSAGVIFLGGFGASVFYVTNNTIANNPQFGAGGGPGGVQAVGQPSDFLWFNNNVLWNNGTGTGYDLLIGNGTLGVLSSNLIGERAPLPASISSNGELLGVNPGFTNSVDFRPLAGSPLRNTGGSTPGGALGSDFAGFVREQGTRIDRGAYEFREVFANGFE